MRNNKVPLIISGVGGSGTRVVAEVVQNIGYYIGDDLNVANDNLLFTLLFKRPKWMINVHTKQLNVNEGMSILEKSLNKDRNIKFREYIFLLRSVISILLFGHTHNRARSFSRWPISRVKKLFQEKGYEKNKHLGWGFKEPNSHLLLPEFAEYFGNIKYLHVVRNGLDMCLSDNQQQLYTWGKLFGIRNIENEQKQSFNYWKRANRRAVDISRKNTKIDFKIVSFEKIVDSPIECAMEIAEFLEAEYDKQELERWTEFIRVPDSLGRHEDQSLCWLTEEDKSCLKEFGYDAPA